jgi:Uma2 family endonuclease
MRNCQFLFNFMSSFSRKKVYGSEYSLFMWNTRCPCCQEKRNKVVSTKTHATLEDLYQVEGKAELVDGELVLMSPTGGIPGRAAGRIYRRLTEYEEQVGGGYAFPDNVGFTVNLPHRESFSPDAAWYVGDITMRFLAGAPAFAVEVRSENDYGRAAEEKMQAKRTDYFACGTLVVWDVDVLSADVVKVYRASAPDNPTIYQRGDIAEAAPAVPGWCMPVDDLFG